MPPELIAAVPVEYVNTLVNALGLVLLRSAVKCLKELVQSLRALRSENQGEEV